MKYRFVGKVFALGIIVLFLAGCKKFEKSGFLKNPGIVLTFDDDRVDNWYANLAMLDSVGARATFYICKYQRFTPEQKRKLAVIQSHGHEIAFHSTNHYNMMDYVYKQKHTIEELMHNEVEAGLKAMNADGFYPTTFAYPYGAHNGLYDKLLMRYFKSVRALNGTEDYSLSLAPIEKNNLLYGLVIDKNGKRTDEAIMHLMRSAATNKACVVLVGHNINSTIALSTTKDRLFKIFNMVRSLGLNYYTASEISE